MGQALAVPSPRRACDTGELKVPLQVSARTLSSEAQARASPVCSGRRATYGSSQLGMPPVFAELLPTLAGRTWTRGGCAQDRAGRSVCARASRPAPPLLHQPQHGLAGVLSTSTQDPGPVLRNAGPMATLPPPDTPPQPTHHPRYTGANSPLPLQRRRWLHPAADIALAIGLLVIDVMVPLIAFVFGLDAAGYKMFDPAADNSSVSLTRPFVYVAVVGGIVLVSAFPLFMARAVISIGVQALAGLVLVLVAVIGMNDADRTAHPQPAPTSPSINPGALCRSGGDNSECGGS